MNELQIFNNQEFGAIRTVEIDGEPWLVGKDVAKALGYKDTINALKAHVDPEDKAGWQITTQFGEKETTIINESGLYSLVLSSKLPGAKRFKRWVTGEVLPAIRKHGAYLTPDTLEKAMLTPDFLLRLAQQLKEEQEGRIRAESEKLALEAENAKQRQVIADFEPIRQYVDKILESTGTLATTQVAADYGLSAKRLNQILHEAGIQRCVNGQWILYAKHMGKGYTKSKTIHITHTDGRPDTKMQTQWTQKGRLLIHETLEARGILAVMDRADAS